MSQLTAIEPITLQLGKNIIINVKSKLHKGTSTLSEITSQVTNHMS